MNKQRVGIIRIRQRECWKPGETLALNSFSQTHIGLLRNAEVAVAVVVATVGRSAFKRGQKLLRLECRGSWDNQGFLHPLAIAQLVEQQIVEICDSK